MTASAKADDTDSSVDQMTEHEDDSETRKKTPLTYTTTDRRAIVATSASARTASHVFHE